MLMPIRVFFCSTTVCAKWTITPLCSAFLALWECCLLWSGIVLWVCPSNDQSPTLHLPWRSSSEPSRCHPKHIPLPPNNIPIKSNQRSNTVTNTEEYKTNNLLKNAIIGQDHTMLCNVYFPITNQLYTHTQTLEHTHRPILTYKLTYYLLSCV